jgi:hypothetical protein
MSWFSWHYFVLGVFISATVLLAVGVLLLAWSVHSLQRAVRVSNIRRAPRTPVIDYAAIAQHMAQRMAAVERQRAVMQQQREAAAQNEAMRTRRRDGDTDQTVTMPPVRA